MIKKLILLGVFVVLIILYATGGYATIDDATVYYSFDNADISGSTLLDGSDAPKYNATITNTDTGVVGKLNEAIWVDTDENDNAIMTEQPASTIFSGQDLSFAVWINSTGNQVGDGGNVFAWRGAGNNVIQLEVQANEVMRLQSRADGTWTCLLNGATIGGGWQHIAVTIDDGTNCTIWINGTAYSSEAHEGNDYTFDTENITIGYNTQNPTGTEWNGSIDEFAIYNRVLTSSEIGLLAVPTDPYGAAASSNFSINATTIYNSSTITTFNATINGTTYGTITGQINTTIAQVSALIFDINITSSNYFNRTYANVNVSSNLEAKLTQAIVRITPKDMDNVTLSIPFNLSTEGYYNNSNILYLDAGNISITFQKGGYNNITQTKTITALMNTTLTMTGIFQSLLTIRAASVGGTNISNFTANLTNDAASSLVTTTNGTAVFHIMNSNYNASVDNPSYEIKIAQLNITGDLNYNFSLYATNSINITFKDEITKAQISGVTINYDLIGAVNYTNSSTSTGTIFLSLLYPSEYTIRYSSADYPERFYYFTLTNRTFNELTLYLLNESQSSNITITVYDEVSHFVENATVKALKYDIGTNSYVLVGMIKTNFEGAGVLRLVKNTEFYKFVIDYEGDTKLTTTPTYIYGDSLTFQITLTSPIGEDFYNSEDIDWTLTFNNATNNFRFFYNDPNNIIEQGCLYLYTVDLKTDETYFNASCISSTTSTILLTADEVNGTTYRAKAYVVFSDRTYLLGTAIKTFGGNFMSNPMGVFVIAILTIILLMIGFWNPSVAVIVTPLPLLFGSLIHIVNIHYAYVIPIQILALIIAVIISKRS